MTHNEARESANVMNIIRIQIPHMDGEVSLIRVSPYVRNNHPILDDRKLGRDTRNLLTVLLFGMYILSCQFDRALTSHEIECQVKQKDSLPASTYYLLCDRGYYKISIRQCEVINLLCFTAGPSRFLPSLEI